MNSFPPSVQSTNSMNSFSPSMQSSNSMNSFSHSVQSSNSMNTNIKTINFPRNNAIEPTANVHVPDANTQVEYRSTANSTVNKEMGNEEMGIFTPSDNKTTKDDSSYSSGFSDEDSYDDDDDDDDDGESVDDDNKKAPQLPQQELPQQGGNLDSDYDGASSISTADILAKDPLFLVLSEFLMDEKGNTIVHALNKIGKHLEKLNKNIETLSKNVKKSSTRK